ncbi:uncharacterized protein L969DRAFT_91583 [Mixia osmundae IAM 14324]|uniref:Uncharacterized protein n=1 Tax=Mixia osmundae (strain CBS 9802 / IAM 14324 / JCM 22182 / KY 12970) TaxID=764103 RepID=G7DZW8_MIXOS|nr:uncharacterized protein L969DRAFT_91583 [Mixia osmundae IAM 14324]KEI42120.1 hypothetical protein L969DRAFT_91583 [Mixia osmundae IAM 14324]GAA96128.1 hypothetical protein E5Q_02789 [Mixia osmundae IAM 14324]
MESQTDGRGSITGWYNGTERTTKCKLSSFVSKLYEIGFGFEVRWFRASQWGSARDVDVFFWNRAR